jgi:hypothetical protein
MSSVVEFGVNGEVPLEWSSRLPYMANGLEFPFEVGGPSSGLVTS